MDITVINPMPENEAREHVRQINASAYDIGRRLLELKAREGWRVLSYKNWTECLNKEFVFSRKHLYSLMNAAPVTEKMLPKGYKLSTNQANMVAQYPEHLQVAIVQTTQTRYGKLTESKLRRVGDVLTQAITTGHVDVGDDSKPNAIDAALTREDEEALKRQKQYIQENIKPRPAYVNGDGEVTPARDMTFPQLIARAHALLNQLTALNADLAGVMQLAARAVGIPSGDVTAGAHELAVQIEALRELACLMERRQAA